jgi:D-alanyl-D-alanine carboxypeptidase (penicillin-binding protein 5/6)
LQLPGPGRAWWAACAAVSLSWLAAQPLCAAENAFASVGSAYIVKNGDTVLWAGAEHARLPPASLTKIMTALLVLEAYRPDQLVTVSDRAAAQRGTRLRLRPGERMRVADLLAATLLASANDACLALAEAYAGTEAGFVADMNRRAQQLGLKNTRFANACGFDAPGHVSSAADLARLTETALRHPVFKAVVAQRQARARTADGRRAFDIVNTNALIGRLPGAVGVKSGYTRRAGKCLVALVERNGVRVLMVLLNARNRWWDTHGVVEHAFAVAAP